VALGRPRVSPLAAVLGGIVAIVLGLTLFAGSANAATIHVLDKSFDMKTLFDNGSGVFLENRAGAIAVDEETDYVYVMAGNGSYVGDIERLDAAGNPVPFPGSPGRNEIQRVEFCAFECNWATGDKYTLTCPNGDTTAEITWSDVSEVFLSNLKSALEAKCGANFAVSGFSSSFSSNATITFQGSFAEQDVPKTVCTKTAGAGVCSIGQEINGADELNVIDTTCGSSCMDIAVDNTGGPNQGIIYVSTSNSNGFGFPENDESGGIHVHLPSGPKLGVIHTRSQDATDPFFHGVRSCGVAVEDNGDLIVAHGEQSLPFSYFDKLDVSDWETSPDFDPPILGTIASDHTNPCRSDVDSDGNVYDTAGTEPGAFASRGPLRKYTADAFEVNPNPQGDAFDQPSKVPSQTLATGSHADPALDEEGNVITFLTNGELRKWSTENGSPIEAYDTELITPVGVTRNNTLDNGTLYVTDGSGNAAAEQISIFKSLIVPDSVTGDYEPTTPTTGGLDGSLDPAGGGEVLTCEFELVNQTKFQSTGFAEATDIPCAEGNTFNAPADVTGDVAGGLTLEQQHHFRLRTTNANGQSLGSIHRFTPHAVIDIETKAATDVAPRSATANASFFGQGEDTTYYFKYGPTAGLGEETDPAVIDSPNGQTPVSLPLEGLELETNYFFRVVATNSFGTSEGELQSFTTLPAVSGLATKPASDLDLDDITLNGEFEGQGLDTIYYFEYGFDTSYGSKTPAQSAGVTNGTTPVSADIEQFNGFRTYHYRVVAENSFGKTVGQDETFVAPDPEEPGIENTKIVSLTPTTAVVSTEVNPNHWSTIYLFEWGESTTYGTALPFSEPIGGLDNENITVTEEITGLKPGTTHHLRAVALNFKGTTEGPNVTFITPDVPRIDSSFPSAVGQTTAQLGGKVAARASATDVRFEYGPTPAYGQSTAPQAIGSDLFPVDVAASLSGLAPGTTYHFRIVATNDAGTTFGPDGTFTTAAPPSQGGPGEDCNQLSREAKDLSNEAKQLRKKAKNAKGKRAKSLRKRAKKLEKQAKKAKKQAKACRSTSGGSGK
jgi:hypothetical protein